MQTQSPDPMVGQVVDGRYLVRSRIARGGMATVYLATDQRLEREVALKVMHPHLADDKEFLTRFHREARSAAQMSHPGIVAVFDQGSDHHTVYLAMEFVPGVTLRDLMDHRGALTPREALGLMIPILDALAAAHRVGIVHRDIKPENVLLTEDGRVKVADFGLARAVSTRTSGAQSGLLIGTVAYLSPELVAHGTSDVRSDVYAAGIMLFEMLTGKQPFTGDVPIQVAYAHVNNNVPAPSTLEPGLPDGIDDIVLWATARKPEQRPTDAQEWLDEVKRLHDDLTPAELDRKPRAQTGEGPALDFGNVPGRILVPGLVPPPSALNNASHLPMVDPQGHTMAFSRDDAAPARHNAALGLPVNEEPYAPAKWQVDAAAAPGSPKKAIIAGICGVLALILVGVWFFNWGPGSYIPTPRVTGLTLADAKAKLAESKLSAQEEQIFSDAGEVGKIVRTKPADGESVRRGGTVTVFTAKGPATIDMPDLRGKSPDEARAALNELGLGDVAVVQEHSDDVPNDRVSSTKPAGGAKVKRGDGADKVEVRVSKGPAPVKVPNLVGKPKDEAVAAAKQLGLKVNLSTVSSGGPAGTVVGQDLEANSDSRRGETITLKIVTPEVAVPDLFQLDVERARAKLKEVGLSMEVGPTWHPFARNIQYSDPPAGTMVKSGSTVTVYLW